jgi:cytochrome c oxidase subunit 1
VVADLERHADAHIHMPSPSYWPLVTALGMPVVAMGLIFDRWICVFGALITVVGIYGWAQEPSVADESDYDPPSGGDDATKELAPLG